MDLAGGGDAGTNDEGAMGGGDGDGGGGGFFLASENFGSMFDHPLSACAFNFFFFFFSGDQLAHTNSTF